MVELTDDLRDHDERLLRQLLEQAETTREALAALRDAIVRRHRGNIPLSPYMTVLTGEVMRLAGFVAASDELGDQRIAREGQEG